MVEVGLRLTGDLGNMEFAAVLRVLGKSYELLSQVQQELLGPRSDSVRWALLGLREGSAQTLLRAQASESVSDAELRQVVTAYIDGTARLARGAERAPEHFNEEALRTFRSLAAELRQRSVGDLVAFADDLTSVVPAQVPPSAALEQLDARLTVEGLVIGRLDAINVHERRETALWSELDRVRVVVTFPEELYEQVHSALRRRVEASGELVEDFAGRPVRMRLRELTLLPKADNMPTLASLVGAFAGLTGGLPPEEWLERQRAEAGLPSE